MSNCATCGSELQPSPVAGTDPVCISCDQAPAASPEAVIRLADPGFKTTTIIVLLNALYFLYMIAFMYMLTRKIFLNPVDARFYLPFGADAGPLTLGGQYWRLLASNYIHFGIYHLLGNMWCLWGLGRLTQLFYSPRNYFMVYTFSGLCGSLLSVWTKPGVISAGASGAVFGVAGVMLTTLLFGKLPISKESRDQIFKGVLQFAALNLVIGLAIPHVDNVGHIGGLLAGMLLGIAFGKHLDDSKESRRYRRRAWLVMILGYMLALGYAVFMWNGISIHFGRS